MSPPALGYIRSAGPHSEVQLQPLCGCLTYNNVGPHGANGEF